MSKATEHATDAAARADSTKAVAPVRTSREQLAWGLVGWMNFIAMAIIGLIIAHAAGYTFSHIGAWIMGAVVLTLVVVVGTLWLMMRLE